MPELQKAVQAILTAIATPPAAHPAGAAKRRVICISRDLGSGGDEIAGFLAERLGLAVYDRQILDRIAERLHADPETMRAVDASARELRDLWLYSLVTGLDLDADHYRHQLENIILSLSRSGGIILGRGAHLVLARSGALRLRITGSPEVCAGRLAGQGQGDGARQLKTIEAVNRRRARFVWEMFGGRLNDALAFDFVINTDRVSDLAKTVDLLLNAMALVR